VRLQPESLIDTGNSTFDGAQVGGESRVEPHRLLEVAYGANDPFVRDLPGVACTGTVCIAREPQRPTA
jgi:hypothetical protein